MALFAMDPGGPVTLEIYHGGQVYTFKGQTVAEAILAAFPPEKECECTNPIHGGKLWQCGTANCLKLKTPAPATPDSIFD